MIPNWLLGKSKSKLQEILGGGGTPADYNQVKAQVNQNTESIALLNTSNQALTDQANSMANVLGAKNLMPNNAVSYSIHGITFTVNSDGSVTANGTATELTLLFCIREFKPNNGNYILSGGVRDGVFVFINENNGTTFVRNVISVGNDTQFALNYSDYDNLDCGIGIESGVTVNNETFYPMIRPASITDDTYVPYAMTNRELTKKLTADANLGTSIDLSAYTAYSNLYTAPSDGYVHFQSAASGSTARTIYTYGNNTTAATDPHFTHSTSANNKAFEVFIKKGLKIYVDGLSTDDSINFYPLT